MPTLGLFALNKSMAGRALLDEFVFIFIISAKNIKHYYALIIIFPSDIRKFSLFYYQKVQPFSKRFLHICSRYPINISNRNQWFCLVLQSNDNDTLSLQEFKIVWAPVSSPLTRRPFGLCGSIYDQTQKENI